jgi:hypothetical protein
MGKDEDPEGVAFKPGFNIEGILPLAYRSSLHVLTSDF